MSVDDKVNEFNWLLDTFVEQTGGVTDAVAVSSDGLLMARSATLDTDGAQQVAAIVSGLVSLGEGTQRCLGFEALDQIIVAAAGGFLYVTAMGNSGCLGAITESAFDMDNVGYQMGLFVERATRLLSPDVIEELKSAATTA